MEEAFSPLKNFLEQEVASKALACDTSFPVLNNVLQAMGKAGLYALSIQGEVAQKPLSLKTKFDNKAQETKHSGALAFLSSQINLSASLIYSGHNTVLKATLLPQVFKGTLRIGNGVSHLKGKESKITVKKCDEGFLLNGKVLWLTGYQHFPQFILGFHDETHEYFALLPFQTCQGLTFSEPLQVITMQATQTVTATLQNYFVEYANLIKIQPKGAWIAEMRQNPHVLPYFYGIGMGALEVLAQHHKQQRALFERLFQNLSRLRTEATMSCDADYLSLRAKFTRCAWQCLQAALTVSKGEGLNPHSRISQLYREIVQFNALATVPEYIDKTLDE